MTVFHKNEGVLETLNPSLKKTLSQPDEMDMQINAKEI